jgi:hypothetical protein
MPTVNKRVFQPRTLVISGVDNGGMMRAAIQAGYDNILQTPFDGRQHASVDRLTQFVRGTVTTQDWIKALEVLAAASTNLSFFQRKSGVAEATGYCKHQINNPVVHRLSLDMVHRGYATCQYDFECKAADPASGISAMWAMTDSLAAPSQLATARGIEITAALHGSANIYHVTRLQLQVYYTLLKASHDGDVGYTAVDLAYPCLVSGSISFQDGAIATGANTACVLAAAAVGNLALTVKQSQGAANKTLTISRVAFTDVGDDPSAEAKEYTSYSANFVVGDNESSPQSLAQLITIA